MVDWPTLFTGILAAGGGGAAIAFAMFRFLGSKWIDARFADQLERSRQDHATATEHLKFQFANVLDRSQKLNQREFETLPDVWLKADEAFVATLYLVDPLRSHPDFSYVGDIELEEWIADVDIPAPHKRLIMDAPQQERNSIYTKVMKTNEQFKADVAMRDYLNVLSRGSIYLHPDTYRKLNEFADKIAATVRERRIALQFPRERGDPPHPDDATRAFRKHGEEWFAEIGNFLRDRYWSDRYTGHEKPEG